MVEIETSANHPEQVVKNYEKNIRLGRFVVVEVEPECEKNNHIGSAQYMKYRSLMSFENDRNEIEVRAILAAKSISKDVAEKAERYHIETKEIEL